MSNPKMFMRGYCPLVEEFHIRNIVGCLEKKQYIFGDIITLTGSPQVVTLASMTGCLVEAVPLDKTGIPNYLVLAQKIDAAPVLGTMVTGQTATQFSLVGDIGGVYHVVIMATGPNKPSRKHTQTTKWANDYCPYCRAAGFKGVVGSIFKDMACFSFKVLTSGVAETVKFVTSTDTTGKHLGATADLDLFYETGQELQSRVTMMADNQYQIVLTKCTEVGGAVVNSPYPSVIDKDGFILNGDASQEYDVLILGQIQF